MSHAYTFAEGPFTPEMNDGTRIFVFGSNLAGRHGKGAALEARKHWGLIYGLAYGYSGQSYGIPTKDTALASLPPDYIACGVQTFLQAASASRKKFLITAIGTGLAGYRHEQIAPLFRDAPSNCVLPLAWKGSL